MALSFEFTDKAEATLQAAIQLAKDYANSQGTCVFILDTDSECSSELRMQCIPHTLRLYS